MPRKLRVEYPGAMYHLMSRGDHLNPVRAKLLVPEDRLLAYPWSSFPLYLAAREHRPQLQSIWALASWAGLS